MKRCGKKMFIALIMTGLMVISSVGCGKQSASTQQDNKVTLRYIMAGPGKQLDSEKVWNEFNKKLKEYIPNLEIKFEVFPMSDYKQKFMLMQTSREKIDIANTYSLTYADEVRKGTFMKLDELVDKNAEDLKGELPNWLWDYMKVDGSLYAIPSYQMLSVGFGVKLHKESAEKYLDINALTEALHSNNTFTEKYYDIMENYLKALKSNNQIYLGYQTGMYITKGYESVLDYFMVKTDDENLKVVQFFDTPEAKMYFDKMADWYKKGYIRSDSLSANDASKKVGQKDGYAVWTDSIGYKQEEQDLSKYGNDIINIPFDKDYYIPSTNAAGGTAIMSKCQNPELAVRFLDLLNSQKGKELHNMLVYGIEGDHYNKLAEDRIKTEYDGNPTSNSRYGLYKWIVGNTELSYDTQTELPGFKGWVFNVVNASEKRSKLIGFVPQTAQISSKLAQISAVKEEFRKSLASGSLENHEQVYKDFIDKMNKAGSQEVINELQKQVDEFLSKKGK